MNMRYLRWIFSLILLLTTLTTAFVYLGPELALNTFIDLERKRSGLTKKEFEAGGLHFSYLEGGIGKNLILLHGFGADKDNFTRVARFLTPHYHVFIPDQIGFGESAHPTGADYSPEAQARNLKMLTEALGIKKFHLGGSSMGGHIAMVYAAMFPAEVSSLWLLDTAGIWNAPKSELSKIIEETGENPLMAKNEKEFREVYNFVMSDPPFVPAPLIEAMAARRIRNFDLEKEIFSQLRTRSAETLAKELKMPTLVVWGEEDRAIHVGTAEVLQKLIPQSKVVIMKQVGHLPMLERPQESAQDFLNFHNGK